MVKDQQVRRLFTLLQAENSQAVAAVQAGMDVKTARKYRRLGKLPSEVRVTHNWRTREDPFTGVWEEVRQELAVNPGLEAKTLFQMLQRKYPGRFQDGQVRTLQRRVRIWRAQEGPAKEVFFAQEHRPGRLCQSDFTHLSDLGITIAGQPFDHMVYHFVLTYSNWEHCTVCFSESFESLAEGLQNALWALGGVPAEHRTDRQAEQETLSYQCYLLALLERELQVRRQHRLERQLRDSRLPLNKDWASFDLKRLPAKLARQVQSLLDGSFVDRRENLLAFGKPGSGKTHLLSAIAQELVRQGRRVYFSTCSLLVQELLAAKRDLRLSRAIKKLARYQAMMIDDLGYVQQSREEMEVLFTLLAERYERGSVLITSNLPFSSWEAIFKDPMTTAAAIDRLVHHCVILELNIPSYRMEQAKKNRTDTSAG